ncbi:MAG: ribosome-associated translation inhibitor RaiA [Candidatus Marinimicrobia bacterium]|jgi:putative sigma-54 modulation protein|nr:ribosome-associated translation inhibitor RaiA [Candidatus Neomarinimicrobiota bacterium]MBT3825874.1 ribosome-associated translation inhibitor RaiA [Candidatus Neomarinimicrobiota bacterium]MBT4129971.1 ribosome-associated translation inhibitor RaiA [Candidatus Neomarinimicrobiota bacterium]MBT4296043.1 ribosome-associated translation inhibitor RaiA [Candidatus Neomarinimicrobiota bacterium]MBT4420163.1 ribosome-associated translation inhibitor RaiA [Candidatus Neomarinimicrobiota bacterium
MKVNIVARHFDISDKTREYIQNEIDHRLDSVYDRTVNCKMIVDKVKNDYIAEVILNVPGETLTAKETSNDLTKSVDFVVKKMRKQLTKHKTKWKRPIDPDKQFVESFEEE